MSNPDRLFRSEALAAHNDRRFSRALQLDSTPWRLSIYAILLIAGAALAFLFLGQYTRKARAEGQVISAFGVARVYAPQAGVVEHLAVHEGQKVKQGDLLLTLSSERRTSQGAVQQDILAKLQERKASLQRSQRQLDEIYSARQAEASNKAAQLENQITQTGRESELAQERVRLMRAQLERHRKLMQAGFVSSAALDDKSAELVNAESQVAAIQAQLADLRRQRAELRSLQQQLPLAARNDTASLARDIAELDQEQAVQDSLRSLRITAPRDGIVTSIQIRPSQTVPSQGAMLDVVPEHAPYQVELYAPSRSIGFAKPGMEVAMRFEAFPYQKFGVQHGHLLELTRSVLTAKDVPVPLSSSDTYYRLVVGLDRQTVQAYGLAEPLRPGMRVEGDILMDRRTLWEWLLEPVYGLRGKA